VRVSVEASALRLVGYGSLLEGLDDLGLRRVELDVSPLGEVPRPQEDGWSPAPIYDESSARAYRERLYDHALSVSALSVSLPDQEEPDAFRLGGVLLAVQAAEVLGAPVVRVESAGGSAEGIRLPGNIGDEFAGLRTALAVPFLVEGATLPSACLEESEGTGDGVGLALETGALFRRGGPPEAWGVLRQVAPYVRCVTCGARVGSGAEEPRAPSLTADGVDYAGIAAVLGAAGYSGALTVSLTGREPAGRDVLRADVAHLRDILGEY